MRVNVNKKMFSVIMSMLFVMVSIIPVSVSSIDLGDWFGGIFGGLFSSQLPCDSYLDCPVGEYCYSNLCQSRKPLNDYCTEDIQCLSGICEDNLCSNSMSVNPGDSGDMSTPVSSGSPSFSGSSGSGCSCVGPCPQGHRLECDPVNGLCCTPQETCFDYCYNKLVSGTDDIYYAWGECSITEPMGGSVKVDAGNCFLSSCYCHHYRTADGMYTAPSRDLLPNVQYNEEVLTRTDEFESPGTIDSTICQAACFKAGYWEGECSNRVLNFLTSDFLIGKRGEFGCSVKQSCLCKDPKTAREIETIEDLWDGPGDSGPSLEELRTKAPGDGDNTVHNLISDINEKRAAEKAARDAKKNKSGGKDGIFDWFTNNYPTVILILIVFLILTSGGRGGSSSGAGATTRSRTVTRGPRGKTRTITRRREGG